MWFWINLNLCSKISQWFLTWQSQFWYPGPVKWVAGCIVKNNPLVENFRVSWFCRDCEKTGQKSQVEKDQVCMCLCELLMFCVTGLFPSRLPPLANRHPFVLLRLVYSENELVHQLALKALVKYSHHWSGSLAVTLFLYLSTCQCTCLIRN